MNHIHKHLSAILCLGLSAGLISAQNADSTADQPMTNKSAPLILDVMSVIGSKENIERLPGSGSFVDTAEIRDFSYDDLNQVIRRIPGVYREVLNSFLRIDFKKLAIASGDAFAKAGVDWP